MRLARADTPLVGGEHALGSREFDEIAATLYADAGIHLPRSKATLVYSRLVRRLRALGLDGFRAYCDLVAAPGGDDERRRMLSALTTNVTRFFREDHHFEHLRTQALPALLAHARAGGRARLWSAACSSGQEPYSMALTALALDPGVAALDVRILATDIDPEMIAEGRRGVYPDSALDDVPGALRAKYFAAVEADGARAWSVAPALRTLVAFRVLNLNGAWPMRGSFDVIFCRNVVIYFDEQTQQKAWSRFAEKLAPGGLLYIGHSERVSGPAAALFDSAGVTTYRRNERSHP